MTIVSWEFESPSLHGLKAIRRVGENDGVGFTRRTLSVKERMVLMTPFLLF